jgi:hypothetical protein
MADCQFASGARQLKDLLDLDRYPIDRLDSPQSVRFTDQCIADLAAHGMFNFDELVRSLLRYPWVHLQQRRTHRVLRQAGVGST